jgi:hypothetical protein
LSSALTTGARKQKRSPNSSDLFNFNVFNP